MTNRPYRILITGSRDWTDRAAIGNALTAIAAANAFSDRPTVIVHGACPTGADTIADGWARWHGARSPLITVERHRAEEHGPWPRCGPIRNQHMVSLGADLCLAFIGPCTSTRCRRTDDHPSHGATGCANLAEAAGIPTKRYTN
ncbi:DUF2493 domain-containing protein [Streptomyces sp. NBC_00101]|uniref:SLOG family protein n=1 Tax=Streptomyces sp. NBC_00101 TaxID=2975651 RepID=UPI0032517B61